MKGIMGLGVGAWVAASLVAAPARADGGGASWPDTPVARLELQALIETLDARLLSHPSATLTLEGWCRDHRLSPVTQVVARRVAVAARPPSMAQRRDLDVGPGEAVAYRRVELTCGSRVLSVADNWYVPARLTPAMNALLDHTDTAFGHAVAALHFTRRTLDSTRLFAPLPEGWEQHPLPPAASGTIRIPAEILRHRALLYRQDGVPFSQVVETYTAAMLDFPPPAGP
ncbi:hypothetical protein [Gluconacetobacter diazotrophicus]|uniref:hypothetical protein n=1 Tax=Gluconacetobacter diazotrophicus TaxID=33996 RepID=UPI0021BD5C18|nr:hypothetical protein [Gluconacetobacter diazotrophicus]